MHDLSLRQNSEKASTMYRRCAIRQPLMDIDRKMGTSMNNKHTDAAEHHAAKRHWLNSHESGYHKAMGNRQVQMIAIGGAIGTGLFLGAGARLQMAGPALALVYLVCGIFSFAPSANWFSIAPPAVVSSLTLANFSVKKPPTLPAGCISSTGQ